MKAGLIAVVLFGLLSWLVLATYGCAGVPVTSSQAPGQEIMKQTTGDKGQGGIVERSASDGVTVTFPPWPLFVYQADGKGAFVVMAVEHPESFPVPGVMTFRDPKTGQEVKIRLLVPPKGEAKP